MRQYHKPFTKKVSRGTGAERGKGRDKKLAHVGGVFAATKVSDEERRKQVRTRGGNSRTKLKAARYINVVKDGKVQKTEMVKVLQSHNPEYTRQNIITKGTIVETKLGKAKITNRVGQDGVVNAVLV